MPQISKYRFGRKRPTIQSNDWECACAAGRMLLSLYGINMTKANIKRQMGTTKKDGTDEKKVVNFFKSLEIFDVQAYDVKGSDVLEYRYNMKMAKSYLKKNIPLFICYDIEANPDYSHYAVVTKIERGKISLLNPDVDRKEEVIREYNWEWFKYWWKKENFWFCVLTKKRRLSI